jgi:chaperonin GroES
MVRGAKGTGRERRTQKSTSPEISAMAVKPLEDRVLVKPIEPEARTASGIYLPEASKEKPIRGKVVAVGPGKRYRDTETKQVTSGKRLPLDVKVGDVVLYGKYAGTEVEIKGDKHLIMKEAELLGVIEG